MRSLLLTIAIILCTQLLQSNVSAKKPSRPLPKGNRPQQVSKQSTVGRQSSGAKGKQQRPLSRKSQPSSADVDEVEDDEDEFELPVDDDDDDDGGDDDDVIPRQSSTRNQPKLTPGRATSRSVNGRSSPPKNQNRPPPTPQFNDDEEGDEDEEESMDDEFDKDEENDYIPPRQQQQQRGRPAQIPQRPAFVGGRRSGTQQQPPRNSRNSRPGTAQRRPNGGRNSGGRVVPYRKPPPPGYGAAAALAQGWSGLVSALPDPSIVKEAALSSLNAAKQTTSSLSANIYREVKGLTSSELEQVMLKATRPDDTAVKGKHVERLVGVTYQISARYDIYDAVLRKLWSKMAEKDWRTTIKALYILHRFAADGSPEHAVALKTRLRELRRTRDPKRKDKFFNSKQMIAGDTTPDNVKFRAFMARYAHYVLLRAQYFSGMFEEISSVPLVKSDGKKKTTVPPKPITATSLRGENYNAAEMLLKAGIVCQLKDGEICENTAIAAERVAADMMGLTSAVAVALNRVLKDTDAIPKGTDLKLIQQWCAFYSQQLLPQTKAMVKKMSPNLDAFGLFLPSRMSASVPPNLLEKGLNLIAKESGSNDETTESVESVSNEISESVETSTATLTEIDTPTPEKSSAPKARQSAAAVEEEAGAVEQEEESEEEEYEYEDEEEEEEDEEEEEYEEEDD
jgi:ANTH domain